MQTIDYVVPSDNLLRSIPDFPYLDLVPGMPKLRHIGQKTFVRLRRFQALRKSGFAVLRLARFGYSQGSSSRSLSGSILQDGLVEVDSKQDKQVDLRQAQMDTANVCH